MSPAAPAATSAYVSRAEAVRILDIKPQTLYAYVSRGLIRSVRESGRRASLYSREDIKKVLARSQARAGHGAVAAGAMRWGEPIIPTAITGISGEGPRYRNRLATELARSGSSFEAVAELLWTGVWHDEPAGWALAPLPAEIPRLAATLPTNLAATQLVEIFAMFTLTLGMSRGSTAERMRNGNPLDAARQVIQTLAGCMGYLSARQRFARVRNHERISSVLARALGVAPDAQNIIALEAILVLLADHELTPSTFAARVAASSGATLHACLGAALCSNSGVQAAQLYDRVESMLRGAASAAELARRISVLQGGGLPPPGFNHPLYPRGDPRADFLLAMSRRWPRPPKALAALHAFLDAEAPRRNLLPRVELGVVALALAMRLPAYSAGALFSISRCAGWVAHVMEQRLAGFLIRPRARFIGA
jgi:citrate synthase